MSDSAARPDADEAWEGLMQQLRGQPPVQPRPYFYSRVQARLAAGAACAGWPGWWFRPAYAMLLGALVLALSGDDAPPGAAVPAAVHSSAPR